VFFYIPGSDNATQSQ